MRLRQIGFWLVIVCLLGLGLAGCFESKNDYSKQGVCILTDTAVWSEPSKKAKWLSGLALGETVTLDGQPVKDRTDSKTEYIKIKLSDGTVGYANTWCIVCGSYAGVVKTAVKVYKRPDLLAEAGQNLEIMQIVAVEEEKGTWVRITGESRAKSGWIDKSSITNEKADVVTAVLVRKALNGKENSMTKEEMEKVVDGLPYKDNYFAKKVMEKFETPAATTEDSTPKDEPADTNANNSGSQDNSGGSGGGE
jgi:hypothetical protein